MRFLIRILPILFLCVSTAPAQVFWENDFGPAGGTIHDLFRRTDGVLFAATPLGVFRSRDAGEHWVRFALAERDVHSIHCSAAGSFLASMGGGLWRSSDDGATWEEVLAYPTMPLFEHSSGLLFTITIEHPTIMHTSDDGLTWEVYRIPVQGLSGVAHPALWTEDRHGTIWTGQRSITPVDTGFTTEFFREISVGPDTYRSPDIFDTGGGNRLAWCPALRRDGALLHSSDDGVTWNRVRTLSRGNWLEDLQPWFSSSDRGEVMLIEPSVGMLLSRDHGATWSSVPLPSFWSYKLDDVICLSSDVIFFAHTTHGFLRLDALRDEWFTGPAGLNNALVNLVRQRRDGSLLTFLPLQTALHTANDPSSWNLQHTFAHPVNDLCLPSDGSIIAAFSGDSIRKSTDGGKRWRALPLGETGINVLAQVRDGRLLAGGTSGLYLSTDMGESWEDVSSLQTFNIEAIHERFGGDIVIAGEEGVYFGSADPMHWRLSRPSWHAVMTLEENTSGRVFAGTVGDGIYFSDDDGMSWEHGGLNGEWITGIVAPDAAYCFAATREHGVFESRDGGATWSAYSEGLKSREIFDIHAGGDGYLYAATGSGVARSSYRVLSDAYLQPSFTLQLNAPNPAASSTVFAWSVPREGRARMVIYDVLGRALRVEFDRRVQAGMYWHTVSADGLLPGTYFCALSFDGETVDRKFQVVR